ncbi:hypothetical protein F4694_006393 [Bacillus niacini]|uniref:Uncharacterized protein n=1 Tax=Neobacillus niacini TaxID=86668 RepID=A0A852TL43_9BACI|nr:hypothetical protein [Neobacillus niacini]
MKNNQLPLDKSFFIQYNNYNHVGKISEKESSSLGRVKASQGWCEPDTKQRMKRTFEMFV